MKYLLDTSALIWFLRKDEEIAVKAVRAVEDSRNQVYVSAAAIWEIAVKASLGHVAAPAGFGEGWIYFATDRGETCGGGLSVAWGACGSV